MITIHKSGKISIPQEEGFIGYAGDNLNKTLEFIVEKHTDENCYYRAFLKFDDDTVNYFILNKKIKDGNTILEWTVTQDQLYKNGIVYLQIKAFNISNVIFHTESVPIFVGDSIEFTDYLAERPNSEFLQQEEHLNNLLYNVENAKEFLPYIGGNGNWYVYDYDTKSYYDTGVTALGSADKYPLTTEITETSTDDNASSAKAVYNYGQKIYSDAKEHFSTTAGDLAYLNTKDKSSLVNAINELETEKISNTNGSVTTENLSAELLKMIKSNGVTDEQLNKLLENKEDITNKITAFDSLLTDKNKYPTAIAVMNYLKDYYYSADEIDGMILDSGGTSGGNMGEDDNTSGDDGDSSDNADTSPEIAQTGVTYQAVSTNIPSISNREGMCITRPYSFSPVKEKAIELGYYNADTDVWNSTAYMPRIKYYIPNAKYLENGYSDSSITRYSKIVIFVDENIVMGMNNTSYSTNAEATLTIGSTSDTSTGNANNIAFSLFEDDGDDSYAYWTNMGNEAVLLPDGIRDGDIIFAGKNTKYYGMKNIDGTMLNDSTSSSELSVDDDYVQNYGISTLALVTDEAETLATNTGLDVNWASAVETAKNAWMLEANGNVNKIPLIIHTDQHGNYSSSLYKAISKMVNWYDISKVINLGDTVNSWVDADTEHPLTISDKLEKYLKATETIPNSKRIEVFGNHDVWTTNDEGEEIGVAPQNHLRKYFRNIYARQKDNYGNFVLTDDVYNIKYLVVSGFAFDSEIGGKSHFIIHPDSLKWIISEMEKVDGYDLIILSHCPLGTSEIVSYYDSIDGTSEEITVSGLSSVSFKTLEALWSGRKSKTSGSITDEYGNTHNFNFTNCDGELLCGLHGHQHANKYYYIGELLDVVFDSYNFNNDSIHFVLVDRENKQLNVWRVDSTPQCQNYQIPFNKTNIS